MEPDAIPDAAAGGTVCAVVVNYRCAAQTIACLESLAAAAPGTPVVVVENDSGDDSAARLEAFAEQHPGVTVLRSQRNGGFGAGCNLGIDRALAAHAGLSNVLLVNPDTTHEPGFLDALRDCAARHPRAGIVGGLIMDGDGRHV